MSPVLEIVILVVLGGLIFYGLTVPIRRWASNITDRQGHAVVDLMKAYEKAEAGWSRTILELREEQKALREERRLLLDLVIKLRERGDGMSLQDLRESTDERWEGGKYVMGEEDPAEEAERARISSELKASLDAQF